MFPHLFFSRSPFSRILFLFQLIFLLSPFDLDLFVFFLLTFFLKKKLKIFCGQFFLKTKMCFFKKKPSRYLIFSRVFSSLRRHFSLFVQCFLFFSRFFIISYLDFSFTNLLFGPPPKNVLFSKEIKKSLILFSIIFFLKNTFSRFFHFSLWNRLPCMIFKKQFAICLCFQTLFEKYLLYPFVSVKKNASKK